MKRCLVLLGASGCRVAQAMVWAACADVLRVPRVDMLVAGPCGQEDMTAELCDDYDQVRRQMDAIPGEAPGFRTELTWRRWPDSLPAERVTLRAWASDDPADELLCRALFAPEAAGADVLRDGGVPADAAAAVWAGLLSGGGQGELVRMLEEIDEQLRLGEKVRIMLCGEAADGLSAAGVAAMARYLNGRWEDSGARPDMAVLWLLPRQGAPRRAMAAARAALAHAGLEELDMAVYPLGLPECCMAGDDVQDKAHLMDWLASCCAADFFRAEEAPKGMIACRAARSRLDWDIFGGEEAAYRRGYGRLMKAAALFRMTLAPAIRRGLSEPKWLRDRLLSWYAAYFGGVRRMTAEERSAVSTSLSRVMRLMDGAMEWMEQVLSTLPPALRSSGAVERACRAAEANYRKVLEAAAQKRVMEQEAEASGMAEEKIVHRHDMEDNEAERMQRGIQQLRDAHEKLLSQQEVLNRYMGGAAYLRMLADAQARLAEESATLHAQAEEALRRIELASRVAAPEEQYRVATARTKLQRMERHIALVDARLAYVREEAANADAENIRTRMPEIAGSETLPECGLFDMAALKRFAGLTEETAGKLRGRDMAALEDDWAELVSGEENGPTVQQVLSRLGGASPEEASPVAQLLRDVLIDVTEEGKAWKAQTSGAKE